jgi:hypothetical protein
LFKDNVLAALFIPGNEPVGGGQDFLSLSHIPLLYKSNPLGGEANA